MPDSRTVIVNGLPLSIPARATVEQIKSSALAAGIEPSRWGSGAFELREYRGSGARLLADGDRPSGNEFGLREVNLKKEPGFKTLEGWDKELVATYPIYVQKTLKGEGARYFSGSWDETTIGSPGFMTPHQISGAAYVPLVKVYTLSGNSHYHIPGFTWVNEHGEPNPYQSNGKYLLPIDDALLLIEAFRKYRAYRRDRFGGGLPPEMQGLSAEELQPIRDYIARMKMEERAGWAGEGPGFATSAHGPGYVKPDSVKITRENVARQWNLEANRVETLDEAYARVTNQPTAAATRPEPPLPVPTPISEKILTTFKRGWNRFYKADGELPEEVNKLTVKWDGSLRIRLKADHVDDFGELLGAEINGQDLTLKRHRSGKYYQTRLDAEDRRQMLGDGS